MLKKLKFNSFFLKLILIKSLVVFFTTGLFALNIPTIKPLDGMSDEQYDKFILGRSFFVIPWVEAPSATSARDGLGPLFNANTCISCHAANGRGTLYNKNKNTSRSLVARLSIPSNGSKEHKKLLYKNGFIPNEVYGTQISINGIHGVDYEARINLDFEEIKVKFPDGEIDTILKPKYKLINQNYGNLSKDTIITYRIAPSLHGLGLIGKIPNEEILKNVDEFDKDNDGISGKANIVYSPKTLKYELGKYTWKASSPSVLEQSASAAVTDMGLTSYLFKEDNCTKFQDDCNNAPKAKDSEDITPIRLEAITYYLKHTQIHKPKQTQDYKEGLEVFESIGCVKCHTNNFKTKNNKIISPYSDFLLHDMGEGLDDGRSEFSASSSEWRTAPLWGLALHEKINKKKPRLLHDGRARNFQEAILWHGGEASKVKENYMNLSKQTREKLLNFLGNI